ncbi:MAG TPA: restriction endonuclease [Tepidisphaeraceae bacterium]|jgi:site-specific DNA-methyltransferase (cytosine-N4-specific)|nr:restriction endonuclease [Tepidisphaeraceae bacterium]
MTKSDLPFGSEFSPTQVDLRDTLDLAHKHEGDWRAFEVAVKNRYFAANATSDYNKRKLANNVKLAMIAYGLIDREGRLTGFGNRLYDVREDADALHAELARHILKDLHGTTLVQCVLDMQAGAETVDLEKLRTWLDERGIHFPRGGKHPSMMRLWLEKAGVFISGWRVDEKRFHEILGISTDEIEALAGLGGEQRAFLKTLGNLPGPGPYASNEIEKLATATYGVRFSEKNLPKTVLYPLEKAGFITLARGTKEQGRGAKPFTVTATPKLLADVVAPILAQLEQQTQNDIRPLLRKPLAEILENLRADDKHARGLALEALAFKLMRLIDLTYIATRLRGTATGGAEVDVIFESSRLVFSRWQVQCKNTDRVSLDDVAKEVGLTHLLKGNVILIVSTGQVAEDALKYANDIQTRLRISVCFLSMVDLCQIAASPAAIIDRISMQSPMALCHKPVSVAMGRS